MGNLNFLSFALFAPFVSQKAQKVQKPYYEKYELSAFSARLKLDKADNVDSSCYRYIFSKASIAYCFTSESKKMVTIHYYILKKVENCDIILNIIDKNHNSG